MKPTRTVLIVEDEANMRRVLCALLERDGFGTIEAGDGDAALERLAREPVDAILTDLRMPKRNGLELLEAVRRAHPEIPVVVLTAHGTVGSAVEALKQGAFDYLTKPFDPDEIRQVMEKAVSTRRLASREVRLLADEDAEPLLCGPSQALAEVRHVIERVAPTPATVLITGESGTGKEIVARSLHRASLRNSGPFLKINCAAIPEGLLESELFGYERGAFTGAVGRKPGRFELADGGTLFLDEIGEMPLSAQPKLLRAIQEGRFYRVGGTETVHVDVRLVAATNRDLREEVRTGRFREDLFYRLHVVPIHLLPLRERPEDIPPLARLFLERFAARLKRPVTGIDPLAMDLLRAHSWPGNIRELENAIERATLLCDGATLTERDLPPEVRPVSQRPASSLEPTPLRERIRAATERIERDAILEALRMTEGNVTRAARKLGLSRRGLQLKMKELEIDRS
ncbi:MAG: sigma-54-dependent Fis family transcriptional regulator [Deltaproteobacteria bacterium]|nr:sigma-54-dependent Fis family transcriptional regulator [Deltaproteobacteria bacterium]